MEQTKFVQAVLSEPGTMGRQRRLSIVRTADIERMRRQIQSQVHQGIGIGDKVKITTGPYRNIEATVIEEIPEQKTVQVFVKLRSKQSIVTIPRSGLLVLERAPLSPLLSRLTTLCAWLRQSRPVVLWQGDLQFGTIDSTFSQLKQIAGWMDRGRQLFSLTSFGNGSLEVVLGQIRERHDALKRVFGWESRFGQLFSLIRSYYGGHEDALQAIQAKLLTLAWMDDVEDRLKRLGQEIDAIAHAHGSAKSRPHGDEHVVQNVLVDGHNLAFRCLYAPGMADLQDSTGRPTGVILGVLRSLGALRKRYPEARLYVAWDGASRRRKKVFAEYKANRPVRGAPEGEPVFNQMEVIQRILPLLGVRQAFNGEEEADDIIAALVRGGLSAQQNLIFSSDRDLLQLVTSTTTMLVPGSGIRKEILFDEALVEENFGVPPAKLLQLRAFYGDSSDNIPGVPRVPKKVLCSLVQAHGSVDHVYKSGLTGLTKGQYERLRASEPQVRINLVLMSLVDVPVSVTDPDVDADLATSLLREIEVNPNPILEAFFGPKAEAADE